MKISPYYALSLLMVKLQRNAAEDDPTAYFDSIDNAAYLDWLQEVSPTTYDSSVFLPSSAVAENGLALHWTLDGDHIILAVATRATGWVGFGIGEAGGMKGSDMVIFESATNDIFDGHVLDNINAGPIRDDCQNWELLNSTVGAGFLIFEAKRLLDTGDSFDRVIMDDSDMFVAPHRVIGAWGDTEMVSYHGADNRVRSSIRFHRQDVDEITAFQATMDEEAEGSFELRAVDYAVKPIVTEYHNFCFTNADLIQLGMPANADLHVVGIAPVIDQDAKAHVHHFVLTASENTNEGASASQEACDAVNEDETAYSWAPGEGPFALPLNVGGPLGTGGFQSYKLEIHYDNPALVTGSLDSSGVRMFYSSQKREHDMGILELGDGLITLGGQSVTGDSVSGYARHTFDCPSDCSAVSVSEKSVIAIRETLHMHGAGQRMSNEQIRDGNVIRQGAVDFWDVDQQGDLVVQQRPFDIKPGDSFRTRCYFQSADELSWGVSSQDEMCMASVYYYPRQIVYGAFPYTCVLGMGFDECDVTHEGRSLNSADDLERSFGRLGVCSGNTAASPTIAPGPSADSPTIRSEAGPGKMTLFPGFLSTVLVIVTLGRF